MENTTFKEIRKNVELIIRTQKTKDDIKALSRSSQKCLDWFLKDGRVVEKIPEGFEVVDGTLTEPNGYRWYSNRKSRFSDERVLILAKNEDDIIWNRLKN